MSRVEGGVEALFKAIPSKMGGMGRSRKREKIKLDAT